MTRNKNKKNITGINCYPHPFIEINKHMGHVAIDFYDRKDKTRFVGNAMPTLRAFIQKMGIKAEELT